MPENESVGGEERPADGRRGRLATWAVVAYLVAGLAVFGPLVCSALDLGGAKIDVTNLGATRIDAVTLHTCGSAMTINTLLPGETRDVRFATCPDSGLRVDVQKAGRTITSEPDFYVCSGLRVSVPIAENGRATPDYLAGTSEASAR